MSKIKNVYFQDDIAKKLSEIENISGLVNELMRKHFALIDPSNTTELKKSLEEIKTEKTELEAKETIISAQIIQTEEDAQALIDAREKKEQEERNSPERWERIRQIQRSALDNYKIPEQSKESVFNDFFELLKTGKVKNLIEFAELIGIVKKDAAA